MKKYIALALLTLLGCSDEQLSKDPTTVTIKSTQYSTFIPAKGELIAANETTISVPMAGRGTRTIEWLMPEYTQVKKGDVIARFDGTFMEQDIKRKQNDLSMSEQSLVQKQAELDTTQTQTGLDINLVEQERQFAEDFSIDDIRIRSKLEILESMQNVAFLNAKTDYLGWKENQFSSSAKGQLGLLELQASQHNEKIQRLNVNLSNLEVKAPHSGLLTYQANWRGEKPKPGEMVWPGQKLAALPDTSELKLKLFVSEREAIGLEPGQDLTFYLLAQSDSKLQARVESVSPMPKTIERGDPQKFFEVIATITGEVKQTLKPGLKLAAQIQTRAATQALVVPRQAVFTEQQQRFVYVKKGDQWQRQEITLGKGNLSVVEVQNGLEANQVVSLISREAS